MRPLFFLSSWCLFVSIEHFLSHPALFYSVLLCGSSVPLCPVTWWMELDEMLPFTQARLKYADRMMDSFHSRANKTLRGVRAMPKLEGYCRPGLGAIIPLGLIFPKWHLSPTLKRCTILQERCQDGDEKGRQKESKSQCGLSQGETLRPYNRMSHCGPFYILFSTPTPTHNICLHVASIFKQVSILNVSILSADSLTLYLRKYPFYSSIIAPAKLFHKHLFMYLYLYLFTYLSPHRQCHLLETKDCDDVFVFTLC